MVKVVNRFIFIKLYQMCILKVSFKEKVQHTVSVANPASLSILNLFEPK